MTDHNSDTGGSSDEAEIERLLSQISHLAAAWRGAYENSERQKEIVHEYHGTMDRLYELGWDDNLDWDSELPNELMPVRHQYEEKPMKISSHPQEVDLPTIWQRLKQFLTGRTNKQ